jgi:glycosyltransferase involved in cell wall biosynthesis
MIRGDLGGSVSVVIGVYNSARWIGEALDSVLAQTRPLRDVIVVDDGSTDDTPSIVASYGDVVTYLQEEHRGRPHRNRGIRAARGDFIAFIDGDDYWQPQKLDTQLELLLANKLRWAICEADWVDAATGNQIKISSAPVQDGDILEALILNNFIVASTAVVARSVFEEVGYFNEAPDVAAVEDWDLWLRIARRFPVGCVRKKLCVLRLHGDSFLAALPTASRVAHMEGVIERAVERDPSRLGPLRNRALANVSYAAGVQCFRRQHYGEARRCFVAAMRHGTRRVDAFAYLLLTFLGPSLGTAVARRKRRVSRQDSDSPT